MRVLGYISSAVCVTGAGLDTYMFAGSGQPVYLVLALMCLTGVWAWWPRAES